MLVESVDFLDRDNSAWRGLRWISQYTFNVFLFLFIRKQIRQSNSHVRIELFNADLQRRSNWKILVIFLNSTNSRFVVISIPSSTQNLQCFTPIQLKVCRYIPPPSNSILQLLHPPSNSSLQLFHTYPLYSQLFIYT